MEDPGVLKSLGLWRVWVMIVFFPLLALGLVICSFTFFPSSRWVQSSSAQYSGEAPFSCENTDASKSPEEKSLSVLVNDAVDGKERRHKCTHVPVRYVDSKGLPRTGTVDVSSVAPHLAVGSPVTVWYDSNEEGQIMSGETISEKKLLSGAFGVGGLILLAVWLIVFLLRNNVIFLNVMGVQQAASVFRGVVS